MGDRYTKKVDQKIEAQTVSAGEEIVSDAFEVYGHTLAALLISISGAGSGSFAVALQVSPDQGNTWFTVQDEETYTPTALPDNIAIGNLPVAGAYARIRIVGDAAMTGTYTLSVWYVGYFS